MTPRRLKVFVIDDDAILSEVIEKRLRQAGFEDIKVFGDAETGLSALKQSPDFVILDFSLPGLNGLDTLKRIKNQRSGTEVIIHTSLQDDKLYEKCLKHGVIAFLSKSDDDSIDKIIAIAAKVVGKKKKASRITKIITLLVLILILYLVWVFLI